VQYFGNVPALGGQGDAHGVIFDLRDVAITKS
jgi:hypothetical protein